MAHSQHHGQQTSQGSADHRHLRCAEGIEQGEDVLDVDRRLIVLRIGIPYRKAAAAQIRDDDAIAPLQVRRKILEVAAVAGQAVQAQHGRGPGTFAFVDSSVKAQSVMTGPKRFGVG